MNNNENLKAKSLIVPIVSIAAFLLLMFGAGYAYYTGTSSMGTNANGTIAMPPRTGITCTPTAGSVSINSTSMLPASNGTVAGTASPKIVCSCTGAGTCGFTAKVAAVGSFTADTDSSNRTEVTVDITGSGGGSCTAKSNLVLGSGVNTTCTIAAGQNVTVTAAVKFWNINKDQSARANTNYVFAISAISPTFS